MSRIELIATATFGLEAVVKREIIGLGYEIIEVGQGKVTFLGDEEAICRSNLWLRSAERVLVKVGEFEALSFEELFEGTKALDWARWLPKDANFPVEGKSIRSKLFSVSDCQAIVKKAVVEKLKEKFKINWFEETGPRYRIEVALLKDIATLTIDTSGTGLHKRGYRKLSTPAPLKETLAAGLISLSYWNPDRILHDPLCGSGTIPIETALMGLNMAPGLRREFDFQKWPIIPKGLWNRVYTEALDSIRKDQKLQIFGTDIDSKAISIARYHQKEAGVEGHIHFQQMPLSKLSSKRKYGCIICNPPYGERLGDEIDEIKELYREMGRVFLPLETWSFYILTSLRDFERYFGRRWDRSRKLYNGNIKCHYYQFYGPRPPY